MSLLRQNKVEIFDAGRFDVYGFTARMFAEIGMNKRANAVFAETLTILSAEMIEQGTESGLLFAMCSVGVEFDKSGIKPGKVLKNTLRQIIKNWENEVY